MKRPVLLALVCLLALSACRLDVVVEVEMEPDGTGVVTVSAVADADLVARVPDLIDDLRLEDAIDNGWVIDGPILADDGGVTLTMTHTFSSHEELATVLNSIGPPMSSQMAAARTTVDDQTTNAIDGQLVLPNGFESFADPDLIAAVNGLPFAQEFSATGLSPSDAMSFTLRASLPGELVQASGTEVGDGVIEWVAPLDGTTQDVFVSTVQRPASEGGAWASPVATIALVALVVWVVVAAAFIGFVAVARGAKRRRRERALQRLR